MVIERQSLKQIIQKSPDNIILLDKPADWTSFDVVKKVRNIGRFKKVGHAGTLDPFATGLLLLGTGKQTKELTQITGEDKGYLATAVFGAVTDTYDISGELENIPDYGTVEAETVRNALESFRGEIYQTPPMFSAKKIKGQRLYKLARKGVEVEREPQKVTISRLEILEIRENEVDFYVRCSKGTYVRTLAHDLGQKTGYGAYLKALRRVEIGDFHVGQAMTITEFQTFWMQLN
jgi:tRNA pseudouridine55 synthase